MAKVTYDELVKHLKDQGLTDREIEYLTNTWSALTLKINYKAYYDTNSYNVVDIITLDNWYNDIKNQFENLPFPYSHIGKYLVEMAEADKNNSFITEYSEYVESLDECDMYMTYIPCYDRVVLWERQ